MQKQPNLTQGSVYRQMIAFAIPIMVGTVLQQIYNMADTMIVSYFVGKQALAAVGGSSTVIIILLVNSFVALCSGASVVISQYFGAGERDKVRSGLQNALLLSVMGGLLIMAIGIPMAEPFLRLLQTPEDTIPYSLDYIRYYFLGMVPSMIYNMGSSNLRAMGESRKPLGFLAIAMVVNIVLDLLFVVVFRWEVAGAAIATTLAQIVSAVLTLRAMWKLPEDIRPHIRGFKVDIPVLRRMLYIGLPAMFQSSMYSISNLLVQTAINRLDTDVVAGWAAFRRIDDFYWPISGAIGIAITTFVGQNFGAKRYGRVRECIRVGTQYQFGVAILFAIFGLALRKPVISIFANGDPNVLAAGMEVGLFTAPFYFTFCCIEIYASTMRGVGNVVKPMIITMCCICLFRVIYLVGFAFSHLSIFTVAMGHPISWSLASLVFLIYYKSRRWLPAEMREEFLAWHPEKKHIFKH